MGRMGMGRVSAALLVVVIALVAGFSAFAQTSLNDQAGTQAYVVTFEEPGLLYYDGNQNGLEATRTSRRENGKFDSRSPAARAYSSFLKEQKDTRMSAFEAALARDVPLRYHYQATKHGVLLDLTADEAQTLRSQPGVVSVTAEPVRELATDQGPWWINADTIWDGTAVPGGLGSRGEGIVIGVVDTGANTDNHAFREVGPMDSYVHVNPLGDGNYLGHCIGGDNDGIPPPNAEVQCNNKLIGAWAFTNATDTGAPEDTNGHGSHTASTSGGNIWDGPFFDIGSSVILGIPMISGVAPHANIIAYDVCETSTCSATSAGIDRAIMDGVDVINFSISGGNSPWSDNDRMFLDAVNAGIFVAASAGNTGTGNTNPIADTSHDGPWVMTVAASTHDRGGDSELQNMTGGNSPPADMTGQTLTGPYGPAPIVWAGDFSNGDPDPEQCLNPFPANTWTNGEIVLCDRGTIARVLKGANVAAGGAAGHILGNVTGGTDTEVADYHVIPSIHVSIAKANLLRTWLASGAGHMGTLAGRLNVSNPATADVLAGFSLRGPNLSFDVTKPSVTNPGVSIMAAELNAGAPAGASEVGLKSGTSMSSPHTAGAGALMMAIHPDWTVQEIKSAMMLTADKGGRKEDNSTPTDPDDVGGGRVDLFRAAHSSLVMDETFANFLAANPATGGDPKTLNVPSARNSFCVPDCSWTRRVRNATDGDATFSVSTSAGGFTLTATPANFVLASGDVLFQDSTEDAPNQPAPSSFQTITIMASGVPDVDDGMSFGEVTISDNTRSGSPHSMTVSVNVDLPYGGTPPPG